MGATGRGVRAEASILPLDLTGLGYRAGADRLLADVTLTVRPGRRLVVLGPNGAGKSLLLRLCHGLIAPSEGRIRWALPESASRRQAMVFQRPVLLRRSARGNLDHALAVAGLPRPVRRARAAAALERFGLVELADRPARRLSGGEQQRLAMARAWALRPEIMFLDEPTSQLDPAASRLIEAMIRALGEEGMTVVMTTHDLGQARRLAEDVAFLHRGRLIESGPAEPFFAAPASAEARAFLAGELLW
jgi:tungstate transport system ATP-binding protein